MTIEKHSFLARMIPIPVSPYHFQHNSFPLSSTNRFISRTSRLQEAVDGNNLVKVITGIHRSGKSFLLFELFAKHLKESGVRPDTIIQINLADRRNNSPVTNKLKV